MRKKLLIILLCCVCGVAAAAGGAAWWAASHLRSPEFRSEFVRMLREATGREVSIRGDLEVSMFPWIGLTARGFSLGNDPAFGQEPLLTADALSAHVKVLPLFRRRLVFDTVDLEGANLALVLDRDKRGNWDGLLERLREQENATLRDGEFFRQITVRGLRVTAGKASLDDQRHGFTFATANVALRTGRIESGQALPFAVSCDFSWPQPGLVSRLEATGKLNWSGPKGEPLLQDTTAHGEIGGTFMPKDSPRAVVSTGGSVVYGAEAMERLRLLGPVVYLEIGLEDFLRRVTPDDNRGLAIASGRSLADLFAERQPLYSAAADFTVRTDRHSHKESLEQLMAWLEENPA